MSGIQVLPTGGSIAGRIGAGIGRGLSESLPKEVERWRLSQGLQNLKNNPGQSQFDNLINLYSTPGVTPEMAQQLAPLLNQAAQKQSRQNGQNRQQGQSRTPIAANQRNGQNAFQPGFANAPQTRFEEQMRVGQPQQQQAQPGQPRREGQGITPGIPTAEAQQAAVSPVYRESPQEIRNRADELIDEHGYSDQQAQDIAQREADTNYANAVENQQLATRQNAAETNFTTKLDDKIQNKTHKTPKADSANSLFKTVPGEVYERQKQRGQNLILSGKTDTQAADIVSEDLSNMDKAITAMGTQIGSRPLFGQASPQLKKDIKTFKKPFEDAGELETFKDQQVDKLDIGDHLASFQAWEPNKKIEKEIINTSVNDSPEQIAARIAPLITDKDSIFSIGYLLHKVGADDVKVIEKLQDMKNNRLLNTNDRQGREFAEYYPMEYGLGDILWSSMAELTPLGAGVRYLAGVRSKVPATEKIKRYFGKE